MSYQPLCPADNAVLDPVDDDYFTGVGMDGYREYAHATGLCCPRCGRYFEDSDFEDETDGGYFGYLSDPTEHLREDG